jgi:hypothetical protein
MMPTNKDYAKGVGRKINALFRGILKVEVANNKIVTGL